MIFFAVQSFSTEVLHGNRFVPGPNLPFVPEATARFCATRINDTLTFLGSEYDTYLYDWENDNFISPSLPIFRISASGCGTAISSVGEIQVVVAGTILILNDHYLRLWQYKLFFNF